MPRSRRPLSSVATASLTAELARRQRLLPGLQRRHAALVAEARDLAAQIAALGGTRNGTTTGRPRGVSRRDIQNKQTLAQALAAVLAGRTMSAVEAAAAVRKAGYRTLSRNFRVPVAMALSKGPFRRVARGRYTAKGTPPAPSAHGTPGRRRTGPGSRSPRAGSLVSVLGDALKGGTMTVTEAVAAARKAGFRTKATAKSFYHAVATALARSGRFRRVARGKYTAK